MEFSTYTSSSIHIQVKTSGSFMDFSPHSRKVLFLRHLKKKISYEPSLILIRRLKRIYFEGMHVDKMINVIFKLNFSRWVRFYLKKWLYRKQSTFFPLVKSRAVPAVMVLWEGAEITECSAFPSTSHGTCGTWGTYVNSVLLEYHLRPVIVSCA